MNSRCCRLTIAALFILTTGFKGCTDEPSDAWVWLDTLPKPWTLSEGRISRLLPEFQRRFPDFHQRLKALATWRVGTPYEIFKLGEEVEPDPDPIIRVDVTDCTGHILTCMSLAQSTSWQQARSNMIAIHYKPDGQSRKTPTYRSRWHYTTDRITANPCTVDITRTMAPPEHLDSVHITLNRKEDGTGFLELDWSREMTAYYIPNDRINADLLSRLPAVCGVAFVKPSYFKLGLVTGHEGMIIDQKDLIHASQSAGQTERVDFLEYYFPAEGPFFGGIMVYKFVPLEGE